MSNSFPPPIDAPVPSPCVDICRLDAQGLCVGCRRTIDEIVEWPRASEARRREILRELVLRTTAAARG
ncbi:MAG TPA: DUF1289 domain-containing protein [Steroidobacteraceae bacterium]